MTEQSMAMPEAPRPANRSLLAFVALVLALVGLGGYLAMLVLMAVSQKQWTGGDEPLLVMMFAWAMRWQPFFLVYSLVAMVTGLIALIITWRGRVAGRRMALAGTILGGLPFLCTILWACIFLHRVAEKMACMGLHEYSYIQETYKCAPQYLKVAPGKEYANAYAKLIQPYPNCFGQTLKDVEMRGEFKLKECLAIAGKPIDWKEDFALCATPVKYGGRTRRTFIVKTDKVVWGKDLGKSEFVADFPADPAKAGWQIAE